MVEIADRVRRAWCDWDHPDKDGLEIPDPHTECKHGVFALWKRRNAPLQDWLALLAFVADRAGVLAEFNWMVNHSSHQQAHVQIMSREASFATDYFKDPTEAVIAAIDAILDHAQEGDE